VLIICGTRNICAHHLRRQMHIMVLWTILQIARRVWLTETIGRVKSCMWSLDLHLSWDSSFRTCCVSSGAM
jgi:hypothetical protein